MALMNRRYIIITCQVSVLQWQLMFVKLYNYCCF